MVLGIPVAKMAKYALYLAACCVVYKACEKCCNKMCAARDPWVITDEAVGGELGAGPVYKVDGMLGFWTERYMVIKDGKIILYSDVSRTSIKAEYVLAGASAERCATHVDEDAKFYFNLVHPEQGVREFYVISEPRRAQWMDLLTHQGQAANNGALFGTILKIGGITKSTWEERWCICAGPTLDYFGKKTDDLPMGSLWLFGANVRETSARGKKYCIEIIQDASARESRKGKKKYLFALETEGQQLQWLEALQRRTSKDEVINPLQEGAAAGGGAAAGAGAGAEGNGETVTQPDLPKTLKMRSYLEKKGKRLGGFSKRFFRLSPKEDCKETDIKVVYFETEEDEKKGDNMKGFFPVLDVTPQKLPKRLGSTELTFSVKGKEYHLRAASPQERDEWVAHITAWYEYAVKLKKFRAAGGIPQSPQPK